MRHLRKPSRAVPGTWREVYCMRLALCMSDPPCLQNGFRARFVLNVDPVDPRYKGWRPILKDRDDDKLEYSIVEPNRG